MGGGDGQECGNLCATDHLCSYDPWSRPCHSVPLLYVTLPNCLPTQNDAGLRSPMGLLFRRAWEGSEGCVRAVSEEVASGRQHGGTRWMPWISFLSRLTPCRGSAAPLLEVQSSADQCSPYWVMSVTGPLLDIRRRVFYAMVGGQRQSRVDIFCFRLAWRGVADHRLAELPSLCLEKSLEKREVPE